MVHVRDLLIEVSHQGLPPLTLACRNPQILQLNPLKNSISRYVIVLRMYIYIYIYIHTCRTLCLLFGTAAVKRHKTQLALEQKTHRPTIQLLSSGYR